MFYSTRLVVNYVPTLHYIHHLFEFLKRVFLVLALDEEINVIQLRHKRPPFKMYIDQISKLIPKASDNSNNVLNSIPTQSAVNPLDFCFVCE